MGHVKTGKCTRHIQFCSANAKGINHKVSALRASLLHGSHPEQFNERIKDNADSIDGYSELQPVRTLLSMGSLGSIDPGKVGKASKKQRQQTTTNVKVPKASSSKLLSYQEQKGLSTAKPNLFGYRRNTRS